MLSQYYQSNAFAIIIVFVYTISITKVCNGYSSTPRYGLVNDNCTGCCPCSNTDSVHMSTKIIARLAEPRCRGCCVNYCEQAGQVTARPTRATTERSTTPQIKPSQPKPVSGCKGLEGGFKYIVSDIGAMLARCFGCGESIGNKNSVGVHGYNGDQIERRWTFEPIGNKCALKTDIGYASRCNGCWKGSSISDSVFIVNHVDLWEVEKHGDGYAFKADTGKYMARCRGCVPGAIVGDIAFVHVDYPYTWKVLNA